MSQTRIVTWECGKEWRQAPSVLDMTRLRTLYALGWRWLVQAFNSEKKFCMETVHTDESSRDAELRAIYMLGRTAVVVNLSEYLNKE